MRLTPIRLRATGRDNRFQKLAWCAILCSIAGCNDRIEPPRTIRWDFREQHRLQAITEKATESDTNYKIIPGPADVDLMLPDNVVVAEHAREIRIWHDNDEIESVALCGPEQTTDDIYKRGAALMKKYGAPQSAIDKLTEWHRAVSNKELFGQFATLWTRNHFWLGIEVRPSFDARLPWYCELIAGFDNE